MRYEIHSYPHSIISFFQGDFVMKMPHKNAFAAAIAAVIFTLSASAFAHAFAPNALASDKNPPSLNKRVQTITKELTLTDDQVAKVRPILEAREKELDVIRQADKASRDAKKKEMEVREAAFEKDMATLLTPEQNKKFLANRVKREDRRAQQMEKMEKHMDMKMGK